jgi:transcriptional regulator with XRE-family HTH domain
MSAKRNFQSEVLQYTYDQFIANDPEQVAAYEQDLVGIEVAKRIFELRTKAGLSQRDLAKKVGTTASVICRLEDVDYEGHSLAMMKRIAAALDKRVEIRFVPIRKAARARSGDEAPRGLKSAPPRRSGAKAPRGSDLDEAHSRAAVRSRL